MPNTSDTPKIMEKVLSIASGSERPIGIVKLRTLEAFCAAVEEKSISGAARRMYMAPPSVSERLADLEREAEEPLLIRSRLGVAPTSLGSAFYKQARKILDETKVLEQILHSSHRKRENTLRFGACLTLGEHRLPDWLWSFRKKVPEVIPELFMGNDEEVVRVVKSGEVPLGVVATEAHSEELESIPVMDDELVVVVPAGHPWTRRQIGPEDLCQEPFIAREKGSTTRTLIEQTVEAAGTRSLKIRMELGSTTAIKEAIEAGWGFSILSKAAIQRKLKAGTLEVAEGFSIPWRFSLIQHPSSTLTPVEKAFYEFLTPNPPNPGAGLGG